MKDLACAGLLLIIFSAASSFAQGQEARCSLKLAQLTQAPELRGFYPGMTMDQVKARVPQVVFGRTDRFGLSKTTINPDFHPQIDKASFEGVRSISLDFLDGRLVGLWIGYDRSFKWKTLDEFTNGFGQALHLPDLWQNRQRGRQMTCDDFQVMAMMVGGSPSLRLTDVLAQQTLAQRIEEAQPEETEATETDTATSSIIGDRRDKSFYRSDCPGFDSVPEKERLTFNTQEEAVKAGYKPAKSCPK